MIIKSISLKNFKSFGNNIQTVKFNTKSGELILLSGKNGAGKSSFQQSFDFSLFGIVRGKNGKRVKQAILPNRINKHLETEIEFINNSSENIKIERKLEPTSAKIFINDVDETKKFKNYKKEERENVIGFDYETYKSFISMSVSDFTNFIDLTPDEKRKIINKLFNIQDLDNYLSLCNNIIKQKNEEKIKYETIISTNNETIKTLNQNIITIKRSGAIDKEKEAEKLEKLKNTKKEPFLTLKESIIKFDTQLNDLEQKRQDYENQNKISNNNLLEIKLEIKNINEKLKIYESGICPLCSTDLKDEKHKHDLTDITKEKKELIEKYKEHKEKNNDILLKITQISNKKESILKQKNSTKSELNNLVFELKSINRKIAELKNTTENTLSIEQINNNIEDLKKNNSINKKKIDDINENIEVYNELKNVFSNNGIRKSIINNITKPINVNLKEILDDMNSIYNIKISENFNVKIYERMINEIDTETLSMGESKKVNIAIALSYLKLILKFRKLNIIFLDEVFSSMEPDNVEYALQILKKISKEFNLNIIILDPNVYFTDNSSFGYNYFDRVIKIDKKMSFSTINEI